MLLAFLTDLAALLTTLALTVGVLAGWGRIVRIWIGLDRNAPITALDSWTGLAVMIGVVEGLNFAVPINWRVSLAVAAVGLVALAGQWKAVAASAAAVRAYMIAYPKWSGFVAMMIVLWCTQGFDVPNHPDSGLYHFQSVRWFNDYPTTPGIANLHSRLGYNQSWFGVVALLNVAPLWQKGHVLGGVLLKILAALAVLEARFERQRLGAWLLALLFVAVAKALQWLSSPAPDLAVSAFEIPIFVLLLRRFLAERWSNETQRMLPAAALLCCAIVTIKLSSAMFALASLAILVPAFRRSLREGISPWLKVAILCAGLIGAHLARGYLLSGLPLYPSTIGAAWALDWAVLPEVAADETRWILSWARSPGRDPAIVLGNWNWFGDWALRLLRHHGIVATAALGLSVLGIALAWRSRQGNAAVSDDRALLPLFIPLTAAVLFWFFTAPDWRFFGAIPWLMISLGGWLCVRRVPPDRVPWRGGRLNPAVAIVGSLLAAVPTVRKMNFGWSEMPTYEIGPRTTDSGLELLMPSNPNAMGFCWDAPLPCTPYYNAALRQRDPDRLQAGFSVKAPPEK